MPILITEEIFQAFLKCETKAYLKYPSTVGVQREGIDWQRRLIEDFRQKCAINLRALMGIMKCWLSVFKRKRLPVALRLA